MNLNTSRRSFLKTAAVASAALGFPAVSYRRVLGANDALRVAVVGFNGRGADHIAGFLKPPASASPPSAIATRKSSMPPSKSRRTSATT